MARENHTNELQFASVRQKSTQNPSRLLKNSEICNEASRGASHRACEEPISSRDMFLATFHRTSGYARSSAAADPHA
jgi:hypothetical protein